MKKLVPVLLLLLAACGGGGEAEDNQAASFEDGLLANLETASTMEDPAQVRALVDRAMPTALPPGSDPQYRSIRAGVGGAACGEVATLGPGKKHGPFRPFVVTPEAVAVIGSEPQIKFSDPSDFLADAWIRWCASPEELAQLEGKLGAAAAPEENPLNTSDIPDLPEGDLLPPPGKQDLEPGRRISATPPPPPPPAQIDSFSKSISRPES